MTKTTNLQMTNTIWKATNAFRGSIDSSEYKQYILPLVFYKYLSDKELTYVLEITEGLTDDLHKAQKSFEILCKDEDTEKVILKKTQEKLGYTIKPEYTFMAHIQSIENESFHIEKLDESLQDIQNSNEIFEGIFDDMDLYSKKIGRTIESTNKIFSEVLKSLSALDNLTDYSQKYLGDFFEGLIDSFASSGGKKSGEFYSSQSINKLLAQIVLQGKEKQSQLSIYDPVMGSGSLLLSAQKYFHNPDGITFYGQEKNLATYNLARMNMFFHGVSINKHRLKKGDTLEQDWPTEGQIKFNAVLMDPPYSLRWLAEKEYLSDPRFEDFGILPPKSKADYAFLLHGYHHLKDDGTMAILLPHGTLFRGGAEGKIRQALLDMGAIDAIIGLPSNLIYGTGLPTVIIVLKKNRITKDTLFIDASPYFKKGKNQNVLTDKQINTIIDTYKSRKEKPKYAYVASYNEIVKNNYNLNIPRYVDTFEETEVSLEELSKSIKDTQQELNLVEKELTAMLKNLQVVNKENNEDVVKFIQQFMDYTINSD